jgi:hypothetical protein
MPPPAGWKTTPTNRSPMPSKLDTRRIKRRLAKLPEPEAAVIWQELQKLPGAYGHPHVHSGLGLRQLRPGLWEGRAGLAWRFLFRREGDWLVLVMLGTHDDVADYLRNVR